MSTDNMDLIEQLVQSEDMCVLATSNGKEPHTSLMVFFADHAVMKFYFLSRKESKKNKNLKACPYVSILIDQRDKLTSLAIDGVFSPLNNQQTIDAIVKLFLLKHPDMKEFAEHPDTELIRIEGRHARLTTGYDDVFTTKLKNK